MLIERAEFFSQELGRQSFSFKPDRLNLLSTEEDQKKADLFSSLALVFWGEAVEGKSEPNENLKEGSLELAVDGKKLTLHRNFESNLFELKSDEISTYTSTSDLLAGISKDMFNSLFLVGQDEGGSANFVDRSTLISLLGQFASVSEHSINLERSVKLVTERLEKYPFRGKTYKVDDLIAGLDRGKIVLEERLIQLERERKSSSVYIDELKNLEEQLEVARRMQKREEYFQLCLEAAELDARIMKVQQRLLHEAELKRELAALGELSDFPINALRKVQEMWTMRQSRLSDLDRVEDDIAASTKEAALVEAANAKESDGIEQFLIEDAQQLYGLAKVFSAAQEELEQLQSDRTKEMRRLKDNGVDFDAISLVRKSLLQMSPLDLETANQIADEFKYQKDRLSNLGALLENTRNQLKNLSAEIVLLNAKMRELKTAVGALAAVSGVLLVVCFLFFAQSAQVIITIALTSLVLSLIAVAFLPRMHASMRRDFEAKVDEIENERVRFVAVETEQSDRVVALQGDAEKLASKYGMSGSADLFRKLQVYSSPGGLLKQLDLLDHVLATREQQLLSLNNEALAYFDRIERKVVQMTPAAITGLASEILRYKENSREMDRGSAVLNHKLSERQFLQGEVAEIDRILQDLFRKARLPEPHRVSASFEEFERKAKLYRKWESLTIELQSMEKSLSAEILEHDLSTLLYKLQHRRTDAWNTMQDLIERYPDILTETIEDDEIGKLSEGEIEQLLDEIKQKESRIDDLKQLIRSASKNFDEFHPKTQHELEILERDLDQIKHNRKSLLLAQDNLRQVAQENKSSWSHELADISADMLKDAGLEVSKIEWDENMEMTLTLSEKNEAVHESLFTRRVPRGLIKQINWLTRLMLCRYIARRLPLPVVLDEPFADLDDKRFAGCMSLLLRKILPHCQLIVMTSQRVRHQWYVDKLSAAEKERIMFI